MIEKFIQNNFTFEKGRQGTGYQKHTFFEKLLPRWSHLLGIDCHLLYFPDGTFIPKHIDEVKEGNHYRLNIVVKAADSGGDFITNGGLQIFKRIFIFRPDVMEHEVTKCNGTRYVLSFGLVTI